MNIKEIKHFINEKLGNEYKLLNNSYKNTRTKLHIKHMVCNNEYEVVAYNILKDKPTKCPYCFGHRKLTKHDLEEKFKNYKNGNYKIISGNYINYKSTMTFQCTKCNTIFNGVVNYVLNGSKGCPNCNKYHKTHNDFLKEIEEDFELLDEYKNNSTKIRFKHKKCNNIFELTPSNFLKKINKCPYCTKFNKKNTDIFKYEIKQMYGDEYELLDEYKNNSTKVLIKHNICNNSYKVLPSNFSLGYKCPICSKNKQKLTNSEFIKRVKNLVGDEYEVLDEYKTTETKIRFKHNKCNTIFEMTPHHFLAGQRCKCSNHYYGEDKIANWLDKYDIQYERNYPFKDLYYKSKNHPLRFDFKLDFNDGSYLLIEFDGKQHFEEWKFGNLKEYQIRDKLKDDYCKKHKYDLLRISYKEFNNIENILEEYFADYL